MIFFIYPSPSAFSATKLSFDVGGGYVGNLYADSFSVSNIYLLNTISASYYRPGKVALNCGYGLSYYEYDSNNIINNLYHTATISVFDKRRNRKTKWALTGFASLKDYTDESSTYNNMKLSIKAEFSNYPRSSLQIIGDYRLGYSDYANYDILRNIEHQARIGLSKTFQSKTTVKTTVIYGVRSFPDGGSSFDWTGARINMSQSVNLKTGIAVIYFHRWSSDDTRPLSSFYIISGVTSYWDPWDGDQFDMSIKRILPRAVLSKLNFRLWRREFSYDQKMQSEIPWLEGKPGRVDSGWSANLKLDRQFNIERIFVRSIKTSLMAGYLANKSDDDYYEFNDHIIKGNSRINIF